MGWPCCVYVSVCHILWQTSCIWWSNGMAMLCVCECLPYLRCDGYVVCMWAFAITCDRQAVCDAVMLLAMLCICESVCCNVLLYLKCLYIVAIAELFVSDHKYETLIVLNVSSFALFLWQSQICYLQGICFHKFLCAMFFFFFCGA